MREGGGFRARLKLFQCEGHGYYWEAYEDVPGQPAGAFAGYLGSFNTPADICRAFAGRVAEVYTYAAYEAACAEAIAADPEGWDTSDIVPVPVLAIVKHLPTEGG